MNEQLTFDVVGPSVGESLSVSTSAQRRAFGDAWFPGAKNDVATAYRDIVEAYVMIPARHMEAMGEDYGVVVYDNAVILYLDGVQHASAYIEFADDGSGLVTLCGEIFGLKKPMSVS